MKIVLGIFVALCTILGLAFLIALPVYLLWNSLMPAIFHITSITFRQALGISILSSLLFKSNSSSSSTK